MLSIPHYVTGFEETLYKAGEHVLMYMLIKINISINIYTKVIYKTPIYNYFVRYHSILCKPFNMIQKIFAALFPKPVTCDAGLKFSTG